MIFVYFNVNEDNAVYGRHHVVTAALAALHEFPNDTIVVATQDSPTDKRLTAELTEG